MVEWFLLAMFLLAFIALIIEKYQHSKLKDSYSKDIEAARQDAIKRSRASIEGQVFEQIVPHLPDWKHDPSDARFIGNPIDFVVFKGMSVGIPEEIIIVEVKKGTSTLTKLQRQIRDLVKAGKVKWELLKIK